MERTNHPKNITVFLVLAALVVNVAMTALAQPHRRGLRDGSGVAATAPLVEEEVEWLQYMREEEKLARDVYNRLFEEWSLVIFDNIAASEQTHYDAIGRLLERHVVEDPSAGLADGIFADQELQDLYNELIEKGKLSVQDALEVGVLIEETDISDLEEALDATTRFDIKRVLTNLLNGSYNHLEAFESGCDLVAAAE